MTSTRLILSGKSGVGKTTLLRCAAGEEHLRVSPTIGVDFVTCTTPHGKFLCWDTSGQPTFDGIIHMFFRDCHAVIYMYDTTDPDSFQYVERWYEKTPNKDETSLILVANKRGPLRIENENILRLCELGNMVHLSCNSSCLDSVHSLFEHIIYHIRPFQAPLELDVGIRSRNCLHCEIS